MGSRWWCAASYESFFEPERSRASRKPAPFASRKPANFASCEPATFE